MGGRRSAVGGQPPLARRISRDREGPPDLVLANARILTLDPRCPTADALAIRDGRIAAVGTWADIGPLARPDTQVVDAQGGLAVPAFHDAHLHLLSYARSLSAVDCRGTRSLADLRAVISERARNLPTGVWVRAFGYDEALLAERRHPDRRDLDAAAPHHPVRLQHRTLHLEVLNTSALQAAGLLHAGDCSVERDPDSGQPTGRLYHAAELLRGRIPHAAAEELARDVELACQRLLSWGITSVQDASYTNGREEWELFQQLATRGALRVRTFVMFGARRWREMGGHAGSALTLTLSQRERGGDRLSQGERPAEGRVRVSSPPVAHTPLVYSGPVKFMLDESTTDAAELRRNVAEVRAAGHAVAIHAVSEAEVLLALDALRAAGPRRTTAPDRIEHAAVIADDWLSDIRSAGVMVVGQPALVALRGDVYRAEYASELHGWLHRARSLLEAGISYAAGSDAPVSEPSPLLALAALRRRETPSGARLGPDEGLDLEAALAACTLGPARALDIARRLGRLRPGALADVVLLEDDLLDCPSLEAARRGVRLTIMAGRVVWSRPGASSYLAEALDGPPMRE